MRKTTAILLLLLSTISSVAKHKSAKKKNGSNIVSIELYHGACYGRCPVYKVAINNEGIATFTGIRFIQDSGVFQKHLGKKETENILAKFAAAQADTFQDVYKSRATDLSGTMLTIKYTSKVKTIHNSNIGPEALMQLNSIIEGIAPGKIDASWNKVTTPQTK